jgi:hypothetical protein
MKAKFEFNITGFILAIIVVSMIATSFGIFIGALNTNYGGVGNDSLSRYAQTSAIVNLSSDMQDSIQIKQEDSWLDVVGGFFSSGYTAFKTSIQSVDLFRNMMSDAAEDTSFIGMFNFNTYIVTIVLVIIFVGVGLAVLLKWKV